MNIQIISANKFINDLTKGNISKRQVNTCVAYLRAKGVVFYDNWSKEHSMVLDKLTNNKLIVLEGLRIATIKRVKHLSKYLN